MSDNVVVLQYLRRPAGIRRTLTVLKARASLHEPHVREFTITPEGITLGDETHRDPPSLRLGAPNPSRRSG